MSASKPDPEPGKRVSAAADETAARGETFYPGPSRAGRAA